MTRTTTIAIAGILALLPAAIAPAQDTERELRRENEALRSQVTDLRAELEALKNENARLRAEIQRLRAALQSSGGSPSSTPAVEELPVTIDESVPNASPRALRTALQASYAEAIGEAEIGHPDSQERKLYLRQVDRWHTRAAREFRSQIEWHIKVTGDERLGRGQLTVMAIDPNSGAELGNAFDITVPRASQRRLENLQSRRELDVLVLKGVLQPQLRVNERLEQPGAFDRDTFLAPFVEYGFTVDVQSIAPPEPDRDDAPRA